MLPISPRRAVVLAGELVGQLLVGAARAKHRPQELHGGRCRSAAHVAHYLAVTGATWRSEDGPSLVALVAMADLPATLVFFLFFELCNSSGTWQCRTCTCESVIRRCISDWLFPPVYDYSKPGYRQRLSRQSRVTGNDFSGTA